jgi:hypothetical protein
MDPVRSGRRRFCDEKINAVERKKPDNPPYTGIFPKVIHRVFGMIRMPCESDSGWSLRGL